MTMTPRVAITTSLASKLLLNRSLSIKIVTFICFRANLDLKMIEPEKTHFLKVPLEDGAGTVSLLITITGTFGAESSTDLDFDKEVSTRQRDNIICKYVSQH